jgi:hypothetical protein
MRQYADAATLAAYPGGDAIASGDADAFLRTASRVVDECLKGVVYDADPDTLLATDADVAQAMADATCAIVVEANATGALTAGTSQQWANVSIGNVTLGGRQTTEGTPLVLGLPVPPAAVIALRSIGPVTVWRCS